MFIYTYRYRYMFTHTCMYAYGRRVRIKVGGFDPPHDPPSVQRIPAGTGVLRSSEPPPPLGPYRRPMPRVLGDSEGGGHLL